MSHQRSLFLKSETLKTGITRCSPKRSRLDRCTPCCCREHLCATRTAAFWDVPAGRDCVSSAGSVASTPGWGSSASCMVQGEKTNRRTLITVRSAIRMWENQLPRNGPMCKPHLEAHSQQSFRYSKSCAFLCWKKNMSKLGPALTFLSASLLSLLLTQPIALA